QHACFEGKKAEETSPRKSTSRTLKEVGQQYPTVFCDSALHSDSITLTTRRLRHITSSSSWRPASVDPEPGAQCPTNPAMMALAGQNDMCITGSAAGHTPQGWPKQA